MEYFVIIADAIAAFFKGFGFNAISTAWGGIDWNSISTAIMKIFDTVVDVIAG